MRHTLLAAALTVASIGVANVGPAAATDVTEAGRDDTPWYLPVTPPACSTAQAESGDVAGCLLKFYREPSDTGWGSPPDPGVGEGWNWQGYTYNGSDALDEWESTYIAANGDTVGGIPPGQFETHDAARALFEGFIAEIDDNGYRVHGASGYSFRCTSGNGGWDCPSGDPDDLSNHAWGLAIDMNAGTNPIRSYSSAGDTTACQTPMQTDMPKWVIETAEKWGLYWGGYGWNSGCADTTTERTRVYRDPPHFEFRGTPEQAAAIAQFNLRNDPNVTCHVVIDERGDDTEICNRSGRPEAGWRMPVTIDAAAGATAAIVNVTATEASAPGYLTLESCDARDAGPRTMSSVTFTEGETVATMAIIPLDDAGRFCVYRSTGAHSIVDVVALLTEDELANWFQPATPNRLIDTRTDAGPVPGNGMREIPTTDSATRLANLAVIDGAAPGFLQAGRCDALGRDIAFSNLNYLDTSVRSNLALIESGEAGSCAFALTAVDLIVDEIGVLDEAEGLGWELASPRRILDTRQCTDQWCDDRPEGGTLIELDLATSAQAAAIAITVTDTQGPGYVSVGLCSDFEGLDEPTTSNLNHWEGQTVTNLAITALSEGSMCVYARASTHLVIDVQAELVDDHHLGLLPTAPTRAHDSRSI